MGTIRVSPSSLSTLAAEADAAQQQLEAARARFAGAAAGVGSGFGNGRLEGQYHQAYQNALHMVDQYIQMLEAQGKALRAASAAYARADSASAAMGK